MTFAPSASPAPSCRLGRSRATSPSTTKATEDLGGALDAAIRSRAELRGLDGRVPAHVAALIEAAWRLGGRPKLASAAAAAGTPAGLPRHFLTKSRRYSATFLALRAARRGWVARRRHGLSVQLDLDGRVLPPEGAVLVAAWEYRGRGYSTAADTWLAGCLSRQYREMRRIAREELSTVA